MEFKRAIVRRIASSYKGCISSHDELQSLNLEKAKEQHFQYCKTFEELGLEVIKLDPVEKFPDGCFVEDTAIIHKNIALMTKMGALSRRGEGAEVEEILKEYFEIKHIEDPATIEGGDVIHLENKLIAGVTQRTNLDGVIQTSTLLDTKIHALAAESIVHLKSYMTYLGNNTIFTTKKYSSHEILSNYNKIIVPETEVYSANTLTVNGTLLIPNNSPLTSKLLKDEGYNIISLSTSEIEKCEGALTCLSLLF